MQEMRELSNEHGSGNIINPWCTKAMWTEEAQSIRSLCGAGHNAVDVLMEWEGVSQLYTQYDHLTNSLYSFGCRGLMDESVRRLRTIISWL